MSGSGSSWISKARTLAGSRLDGYLDRRRVRRAKERLILERRAEFDRLLGQMDLANLRRPGSHSRGDVERRRVAYARHLLMLEGTRDHSDWPEAEQRALKEIIAESARQGRWPALS